MSKVLIFGFPHSGTSILKSIIGHIDEVDEIYDETAVVNRTTNKKYILCKYPFTRDEFFGEKYEDYIKIFIIRNPLWIFSSLNKRFSRKIPNDHSIDKYIETLQKFIFYTKNPINKLHLIRYEDLFENNHQKFKQLLNNIGFNYTDKIFNNTAYVNKISKNLLPSKSKPRNTNHLRYRTYQINQPFINNNDIKNIDLNDDQKNKIKNDENIQKIYPDINTILDAQKVDRSEVKK